MASLGGLVRDLTPVGQLYNVVTTGKLKNPGDDLKAIQADTSPIKNQAQDLKGLQQDLTNERQNYVPGTAPRADNTINAGRVTLNTDPNILKQQNEALSLQRAAAMGAVPSVAELQLQRQAARNAANSFGLAQAIGGRSPGGALRTATNAANQTQMQTNEAAGVLRAQEMENARAGLISGLSGLENQDITRATNQAELTQKENLANQNTDLQKNLANLNAVLQNNKLSSDEKLALLDAQLKAAGLSTQAILGLIDSANKNAAADNAFQGALFQGAGNIGAKAIGA